MMILNRIKKASAIASRLSDLHASTDSPLVRHLPSGNVVLYEPILYTWYDSFLGYQTRKVDAFFECDGASKPRVFWPVVGHPYDLSLVAAIGHDWDFVKRPPLSDGTRMTLEYAAALYVCYLEKSGANWINRNTEFAAVCGTIAYKMWHAHDEDFRND